MGAYRELLAQAKKANHTAIQKLYERYYTLLRSYSFVNGRFDEDLFQTQVIEFLISVSKFRMWAARKIILIFPSRFSQGERAFQHPL